MKFKYNLLLTAALMTSMALPVQAKSLKRGVSENQFQYKAQMEALAPGVSWFYNWANTPGRYLQNEDYMEYAPMCWNANYNADNIREYCKSHPGTKYLLGFNEPNFTVQANMTPQQAAEQWPAIKALADELGLKLVAPAMNYSPNAPYQDPTKWMDEFVALVGSDAFDYTAIHNYGGLGVMKTLATTFHEKYGKDVWVTEFCLWPNEGNSNSSVSPETQIASMIESVEWLEKTDFIHRYAWFKAIGDSDAAKGPNYGLILSGKGENPRELSEQGKVYVYMSDFNPNVYYTVGEWVNASNYIDQSNCAMGSNTDTLHGGPIEITRFHSGAYLDYQFDVMQAGKYYLTLRVAGQGEPTRFDPKIGVYSVAGDTETELAAPVLFGLSGSNDAYSQQVYEITLPAGKQTIRIKDCNTGRPSGIRISSLIISKEIIDNPDSGVENVRIDENKTVDIYSVSGILVRRGVYAKEALQTLPSGLYIIEGKKMLK
ncbi:MAG: glycosyl hydrolase [Muribaculum sp.]|nr:glycosyl hydrolase [Muribaculum sp.]